jgi:hypothetical protein
MTQRDRILQDLADGRWHCGAEWYRDFLPTFAQRLSEVNAREPGRIRSEVCHEHTHRGTIHRYLDTHALRPKQLEFVA